jgi:hypothetical protein
MECTRPASRARAQRLAGRQHAVLAHDFIERARPHAFGQGLEIVGLGKQARRVVHIAA